MLCGKLFESIKPSGGELFESIKPSGGWLFESINQVVVSYLKV